MIGGDLKEYTCGEGDSVLEHIYEPNYWYQYTKIAIDKLLQLKLDEIIANDCVEGELAVKLLNHNYIWHEADNVNYDITDDVGDKIIADVTDSIKDRL